MVARSKLEAISDLQRTRLTEMLNMLVKEGKIERFGAGRGVRYKIKLE
jgi:predicted transcriptional regulator of viral defense system